MQKLKKISGEDLKGKRLSGLDDTPGFSAEIMQARFDAHPDKNTQIINENANIQDVINSDFEDRLVYNSLTLNKKVDKVTGKGLSESDFTKLEKDKLASIEDSANNYILPIATPFSLGGVKQGVGVEIMPDGTINGYSAPAPDEVARKAVNNLIVDIIAGNVSTELLSENSDLILNDRGVPIVAHKNI